MRTVWETGAVLGCRAGDFVDTPSWLSVHILAFNTLGQHPPHHPCAISLPPPPVAFTFRLRIHESTEIPQPCPLLPTLWDQTPPDILVSR